MNTQTKKNSKQKKQAIFAIFLCAALLIGGAFAFLTATDSKTNVFTVGKISIDLYENFNGVEYAGGVDPADAGVKVENVVPGFDIEKEPWVVNTSKNDCYLYMTVRVPTVTKTAATVANAGDAYSLDGDQNIIVEAYALQKGYGDKTDKQEIWDTYFKNDAKFGAEYTGEKKVQLFDINGLNITTNSDIENPEWEQLGDVYVTENFNCYTYVYRGTVQEDGTCDYLFKGSVGGVESVTEPLFTSVTLNETIGDVISND